MNNKINISGLEINITEKCNLNCKGCDHSMGIISPKHIPFSKLIEDIKKASEYFHSRTIRIIGGEPLLHPHLSKIIHDIYAINIANSIELWTNGIFLHKVSTQNWEFLDGIVISRYPNIFTEYDNLTLRKIVNKYNIWVHIRDCNTFSWSTSHQKNSMEVAKILHNNCKESSTCHTIRDGKIYKCVQASFAKDRLNSIGISIDDDGIDLFCSNNFRQEFFNHMWQKHPLNACSFCVGEFGAKFPHTKVMDKEFYKKQGGNFDANFITK